MQAEAGETEVDKNYKDSREVLPDLLRKAPGKYVVMHGGELVEFFDTFGDAVRHGQGKFGKDKFSVQEIPSRSVSLGYNSYALHQHQY
jgi:hypothetical protein